VNNSERKRGCPPWKRKKKKPLKEEVGGAGLEDKKRRDEPKTLILKKNKKQYQNTIKVQRISPRGVQMDREKVRNIYPDIGQ